MNYNNLLKFHKLLRIPVVMFPMKQFRFRADYSMIVATLPEPTVRPPSRYLNSVFCGIFYAFYCGKQRKIVVFVWRIFICMISWHRFGTKNTLFLNDYIYMVLAPCNNNINKKISIRCPPPL